MLGHQMSVISGIAPRREDRSRPPWEARRTGTDRLEATAVAGSTVVSIAAVLALRSSPMAAAALVALIVIGALAIRTGVMGMTVLLVAALPWVVVFGAVLPKLAETFTAGLAVLLLLVVTVPRSDGSKASRRLRLGLALFYAPVVIGLGRMPGSAQFIEAAKYLVFPLTVLAVTEGTNHAALARLGRVALISGAIAVTANLLLGVSGLNHSYYAAGDIDGLGGEHDVALLAGAVTAAALGMGTNVRWAGTSAVGAVATIATGVRSTLPGLLLVVLARMFKSGARGRNILLVGVVVGAVLVSGVGNVLVQRFDREQQLGQFSSFNNLGSGRGGIWTTALHAWYDGPPGNWVIGSGLRSVDAIEQQATGTAVTGQSDLIQAGVELGLVGLAGLTLIWWTLIARARSKLPLLVLLPFALFNGALEYGAPLMVALLLTVAPRGDEAESGQRVVSRRRASARAPARIGG
jgi:hypothetical protein